VSLRAGSGRGARDSRMVRQRGSARDRRIRSRSLSGRMSRKKSRMRLRYAWGANCLCSLQSTSNLAAAIPAAARRIVQERQLRGRQWRCTVWKGRRWVSNWPTLSSLVPKRSVIEEEEKQKEKTEKREVWIWTACGRPGCLWFAAYFAQSCRRDELYGGAVEGSKMVARTSDETEGSSLTRAICRELDG